MEFIKGIFTQMQANLTGNISKFCITEKNNGVTNAINEECNIMDNKNDMCSSNSKFKIEMEPNICEESTNLNNVIECNKPNNISSDRQNANNLLNLVNSSITINSTTSILDHNSKDNDKNPNNIPDNICNDDSVRENKATNILGYTNTLSCIKEFDDILKEYNTSPVNVATPVLTLSETVEVINNIDENVKSVNLVNVTGIREIALPVLTSNEANEMDNIDDEYKNPVIFSDHNYSLPYTSTGNTPSKLFSCKKNLEELPNQTLGNYSHFLDNEAEIKGATINKYSSYECLENTVVDNRLVNDGLIGDKISVISISSEDADELGFPTLCEEQIKDDTIKNCDIISISSTEITFNKDDTDSECDGYHSSDFEFIEEDEACVGLITRPGNPRSEPTDKKIQLTEIANESSSLNANYFRYFEEAGPSTRHSNRLLFRCDSNIEDIERELRDNHVIPEGDDYLGLFEQPWSVYSYEMENKAFYSTRLTNVELDDVGFNVEMLQRRHDENRVSAQFEQEAEESARNILSMYPGENRKRKRRQ